MFSQYYEEVALHPEANPRDLTVQTMLQMWRPITLTSITTMAGFLGIYLASMMPPMKYFGLFALIGVGIAWLYSLTVIPAALSAIIGQRLVRKICTHCKKSIKPNEQQRLCIQNNGADGNIPDKLYYGKGCTHCKQTGYNGRLALYEVLVLNHDINHAIMQDYNINELTAIAKQYMTTMESDGITKACEGLTTLDEVLRVIH